MSAKNQRILYFICILLGGIIVFIEQEKEQRESPYLLILGFVLLMYGLYKATTRWVRDNPRKDSDKDPEENRKSNGKDREEDEDDTIK